MTSWYRISVLTSVLGAIAAIALGFVLWNRPSAASTIPCAYTPDDTPKTSTETVFRAKLQPCYADNDCRASIVTPRCSAPELARCDRTQPSSKRGVCVFQLTGASNTCSCFEGDIRFCDVNGWGSCTEGNRAGCGIQTCVKQDTGGIPPSPTWGACEGLASVMGAGN